MSTRGFVTIATGKEKYYELACNLLASYRKYCSDSTPFAIICDRETDKTDVFDKVIIMDKPYCSYMDKLLLFAYSPYDETIFIDADSLILSDPSGLWEDFADADDVSCYGCAYPLNSDRGWFTHEGCGEFKNDVEFLIDLHGGIYYLRKTTRAAGIFKKAIEISNNYNNYQFASFIKPADEPVLALSLAIHKSKPCSLLPRVLFVPSYRNKLHIDWKGTLYVHRKKNKAEVIHFATVNTDMFLYKYMLECIKGNQSLWKYFVVRIQTAPRNIKATVRHYCGKILRTIFGNGMVDRWKAGMK